MTKRTWRWTAAVLLALLGLARGAGGVLVLTTGPTMAAPGARSDVAAWLVGGTLILVGVFCLAGTALLIQRKPCGFWMGVAALVAFVLGGILNGTLLYGSPRPVGLAGNTAYAIIVFVALWLGTRGDKSHDT